MTGQEPMPASFNTENLEQRTGFMGRNRLIAEIQHIAPPRQHELDETTAENLRDITKRLLEVSGEEAASEYERFKKVEQRGLQLDNERLYEQLSEKNILVTGGTGCIGTTLLRELNQFSPNRVVSISLDRVSAQQVPGVEYTQVDIRYIEGLNAVFDEVKPDIVYHLAAQRDPGLAETDVAGTVGTNITGTRNVIDAVEAHGTPHTPLREKLYALLPQIHMPRLKRQVKHCLPKRPKPAKAQHTPASALRT